MLIIIRFTPAPLDAIIAAMSRSGSDFTTIRHDARERQGLWLMLGGGILLGTIGVFIEEANQHPFTAVWFRCAFGLLTLTIWGAVTGRLGEVRLRGNDRLAAIAVGCLVVLNWALFFGAIARTSIGVATVVFHVQPFWVLILGAWWLHERVSRAQWASALVAFAGLALASGVLDAAAAHAVIDQTYVLGLAMCLGGSISYAVVTLIAKSATGISAFALAWWQCAVGTLVLAWWPWWRGGPTQPAAWLWLAGIGVLHTGLAYVVLYAGMSRLPAGRIATLQFVYPATAVLVDWAVYGRALSALQWFGVSSMAFALVVMRRPGIATENRPVEQG